MPEPGIIETSNKPAVNRKVMMTMLVLLVVLVITDGLITQFLLAAGGFREANPFLEHIVGETGFIVLKIVGALLCALILWDVYRRYPRVALVSTLICVLGYSAIVFWNVSLAF